MQHTLFISVHVPKTAGTSFKNFLESIFGEQLLLDYRSKPLDVNYEARAIDNLESDVASYREIHQRLESGDVCVHGHFFPAKYLSVFPNAKLISWVREPAQRLMSHYQYWRQNPQPNHEIARMVVEEDLSFTEFCELELMQNINSRFFGDLRARRFGSVGVVERYESSLEGLCSQYNWPFPLGPSVEMARKNPVKTASEYPLSATDIKRVKQLNALDYSLYEEMLCRAKP